MNAITDIVNNCATIHQEAIGVLVTKVTRWTATTLPVQVRFLECCEGRFVMPYYNVNDPAMT